MSDGKAMTANVTIHRIAFDLNSENQDMCYARTPFDFSKLYVGGWRMLLQKSVFGVYVMYMLCIIAQISNR